MKPTLRTAKPLISSLSVQRLRKWVGTGVIGAVAAGVIATSPAPVSAQDQLSEARLRKIEAEIRALQRNVFPGGDGRYFEPQISTAQGGSSSGGSTNAPSTTAVTDILARLDAIEVQLQQLTARTEENANAVVQFETRLAALEASSSGSAAATGGAVAATTDAGSGSAGGETEIASSDPVQTETATQPTGPTAERRAAVMAITKPQTDDEADDEYSYGFRLWNAGFYPEARQQLSKFVEAYPSHWRASYGRNLLGRAYLDDGKPEDAARWFLKNYQTDKTAARAPDSLLFLAESMIQLNDTPRACIALAEFGDTYPAVATGRLMQKYQTSRNRVTCDS
ncbi:MAG: hypothetical protein SXU28_09445 [Pseudomonadota bacterium]|nr:hypothetical protein [Pseudomonadota bacterium]